MVIGDIYQFEALSYWNRSTLKNKQDNYNTNGKKWPVLSSMLINNCYLLLAKTESFVPRGAIK